MARFLVASVTLFTGTLAWAQGPLQPLSSEAQLPPEGYPLPQAQYQVPAPPASPLQQPAAASLLSPDQLDNLVAPIALYPDQLLSQVLAASTYPLEIVEAQQWLEQNQNLRDAQLIDAARQQNWDPSIQALVAFPDVLTMLSRNVRWTTDLGNAFLAEQVDLMNAVQRLRARAQQSGRLTNTAQQVITTQVQDGQSAIQIQPANPQVIYVPVYNPAYIWGPPVYGAYPAMAYASPYYGGYGSDNGIGFDPGVLIGALFGGLLNWGGWGWGLNWFTHGLFLNTLFFNHFGFGGYGRYGGGQYGGYGRFGGGYGGYGERIAWTHDPSHRLSVAYPSGPVANRFGGAGGLRAGRAGSGGRPAFSSTNARGDAFGAAGAWRSSGSGGRAPSNGSQPFQSFRSDGRFTQNFNRAAMEPGIRGGASTFQRGAPPSYRAPNDNFRGSSNFGPSSSFAPAGRPPSFRYSPPSAPSQNFLARNFSAPRSQPFSTPRSSSPRMSAPHFSAPGASGRSFSGSHGGGFRSGGGSHGSSRGGSSHGSSRSGGSRRR